MGFQVEMGPFNQYVGTQIWTCIPGIGMGNMERQEISSRRHELLCELSWCGDFSGGS